MIRFFLFRMRCVLLFVAAFLRASYISTKDLNDNDDIKENDFTFNDFLKKYQAHTVKENIHKARKSGVNITLDEENLILTDNIDPTDELLEFDVKSVLSAQPLPERRWGRVKQFKQRMETYLPTSFMSPYDNRVSRRNRDPFNARDRIFNLMLQAIYQAREKMTIMQRLRDLHKENQLYKMGFLFSKTDMAAKTFSTFFINAFRTCSGKHGGYNPEMWLFEVVEAQERLQNLWLDIDLLVDVINHNDARARVLVEKYEDDRNSYLFFDDTDGQKDWSKTTKTTMSTIHSNFTTTKLTKTPHPYWDKK